MYSETKAITVYSVYITNIVIFIYNCPMYTDFYVYGAIKVIKKSNWTTMTALSTWGLVRGKEENDFLCICLDLRLPGEE